MFGKKKNASPENLSYPKSGDAWGWASAAARFRGVVALGLLFAVVALSVTNVILIKRTMTIVGIDREGRPQLLEQVSESADVRTFCKDFVSFMFSYSPRTIERNISVALNYMTSDMKRAFGVTMGMDFIRGVIDNGIVQSCAVNNINVTSATEKGFETEVAVSRIRSSVSGDVTEAQVLITMKIERGSINRTNPWGLYVSSLVEKKLY